MGNAINRDLRPYFDTYGTYFTNRSFRSNQQFFRYDLESDDVREVLEKVRPQVIVSSLRGNFEAQVQAHHQMLEYISRSQAKLYFISSANVFDAYSKYPSYEYDKTLSESVYGRFKIKIENMLMRMPRDKTAILRVPMVFGNNSPRVREIKAQLDNNAPIEVFPNLIVNVTNDFRLTQQIHYLINRDLTGIYHLGSSDLIQHEEFIKELIKRMGNYHPVLKRVYTTNEDRYLAALPKDNQLPENLRVGYQEVLDHQIQV